jgi:hypothetical protein
LVDHRAEKRRLMHEMKVEITVLERDLAIHDSHEANLMKIFESLSKESTAQLTKLKSCDAASSRELNLITKLKKMVQLIMGPNPPSSHHVAEALDKLFGEALETEIAKIRESLLASATNASKKAQHASLLSETRDEGGSVSNLLGSYMQLGSRTNLGSKSNLGSIQNMMSKNSLLGSQVLSRQSLVSGGRRGSINVEDLMKL